MWVKDDIKIAEIRNLHSTTIDSRYSINMTSYSLIIDGTNLSDTSTSYQCTVSVSNPITNTMEVLQISSGHNFLLSLQVFGT
jgi:hypothetical protein